MPREPRVQFAGALYHVTSRGNGRHVIFHTDRDRQRFLEQLGERAEAYGVLVYAFVLMANHFHLLVRTPRANLNRFMQRLNTSYALYYRYKHARPGHVFQGRYRALLVTDDDYLLTLTRYIHLNPVKSRQWKDRRPAERIDHLNAYRWSSYLSYASGTSRFLWLSLDVLAHYGRSDRQASVRYRAYTEAMIGKDDDELADALRTAANHIGPERQVPKSRPVRATPPLVLPAVDAIVARHFGVDAATLTRHGHAAGAAKRVAMELAARSTNESLARIGAHYGGLSASAVTMNRKRLRADDHRHIAALARELDSS